MAQLTWKNVNAPTFSGVTESQRLAAQLLNSGFGSLQKAITGFQDAGRDAETHAADIERRRLINDAQRMENTQTGWNNNRIRGYEEARPEAVARVNEIRSLSALGTDEGRARAHALMRESSDVFAANGWTPDDVMGMINGNINTANIGLASNQAFQRFGDSQVDRTRRLEAEQLAADVLQNAGSPADAERLIRSNADLDPRVATIALADVAKRGPALFGQAPSLSEIGLDQSLVNNGGATSNVVDAVVDRIIGVESGGDPNAENPLSTASGLGQFTDGTWIQTIKRHRPDIAAGKSNDELLALKKDRALGREMTTRLTEDNARFVAQSGQPVTPGNIYLAHFAGQGGFRAIMNAPDTQSLENVLGAEVIRANPFLAGKNVAWIKNWANRKMGQDAVSQAQASAQSAEAAIQRALDVSADSTSAADTESLITARNVLAEQGQTLIEQGVTDEIFNQTAPLLQTLTERPDRNLSEADVVRKLHAEVGDDDGLPLDDLTDQLNRVTERYGISPDIAAAIMKSAIEQTTWGARWIMGNMQLDHQAMDQYFRRFINPNAQTESGKLQPTVEQFRALRVKRDAANQVRTLLSQLQAAEAEYASAKRRQAEGRNVDVSRPLERYQELLDKALTEIDKIQDNPLLTVNTSSLTGM